MEKKNVPKWIARMKDQIDCYVCFTWAAVFLAGAILCYNVVNYNVVVVLATYFTDSFNEDAIHKAIHKSAVLVNVLGGLQVVVDACTWAYPRSFGFRKIIILSTVIYVLSLLMLYLSASNQIPKTNFVLYICVCVLIAVGKSGGSSILVRYLFDQLMAGHENIEQIDWKRSWCRRNIWLVLAKVLVVIIPFGGSWSAMFWISMCIVGPVGFISLVSSYFFNGRPPASCKKTHLETSGECNFKKDHENLPPDQPFKNEEIQLIKSSSNASAEAQLESRSPICSVKQVNVADHILRMIPMWSTFIVFSLVISTADTFFNLQDDSMTPNHVSSSNFFLAKDVLIIVADFLCGWFLEESRIRLSRSEQNFVLKMIICVGIILSIICPSLASQVEVQRLENFHEMKLQDKSENEKVSMSDWYMAPLFGLWGLMEGISVRGLDEFFNYHVSKSMKDCGSEIYNKIPIAMGNLLSAVCVSSCEGWFGDTLNQSRLDKYYRMITVLAWINLCWFFFVTAFYSTKEEEEEAGVELQESIVEVVAAL